MDITGFLRWWREQLADWLPAGLRAWFAGHSTKLSFTPTETGWQATVHNGKKVQNLGSTPALTAQTLHGTLSHVQLGRVELQLQPGQFLSRTLDLPLAAADDLKQAISYQIETLTPFKRDQVWLYCGEQQRLPDGKRLRAWWVAIPRQAVTPLTQLAVKIAPEPYNGPRNAPADNAPITLSFRPAGSSGSLPLGWLLLGLNLLALTLAAGLHLDNRETELALLKAQARALQNDAIDASDLDRQSQLLQNQLDKLQARHSQHPPRVAVLDELTSRLDDQTWVHRLELRQQQVRLQGSSTNASALIGQLDASPLISDVRFEASLTRDPAGGERFNLTGRINPIAELQTETTETEEQP